MAKTVLITGGSGLIGKALTSSLLQKGHTIHHLSRSSKPKVEGVKTFVWDIESGQIDSRCLENVDTIIHLAGESIGARPWTRKQKKLIIESRTESIRLIYQAIRNYPQHQVKTVISASGVGYYGNRGDELLVESSSAGKDFMADCCAKWEQAVDEGAEFNLRISKLRTGVVLSEKGGALEQIARPIKAGFGAALGSGNQWFSWIHLNDLVNVYQFLVENEQHQGTFNASAPQPVTNSHLTKAIARQLNKTIWMPNVPAFALRVLLGEMCALLLNSTKTSDEKIKSAGYRFTFETVEQALNDLYR